MLCKPSLLKIIPKEISFHKYMLLFLTLPPLSPYATSYKSTSFLARKSNDVIFKHFIRLVVYAIIVVNATNYYQHTNSTYSRHSPDIGKNH